MKIKFIKVLGFAYRVIFQVGRHEGVLRRLQCLGCSIRYPCLWTSLSTERERLSLKCCGRSQAVWPRGYCIQYMGGTRVLWWGIALKARKNDGSLTCSCPAVKAILHRTHNAFYVLPLQLPPATPSLCFKSFSWVGIIIRAMIYFLFDIVLRYQLFIFIFIYCGS